VSLVDLIAKSIREPRKAVRVASHRLLAPVGRLNYRKFVVLTRDRTGSNMLIQALNSHPRIAADYEIFAKLNGRRETSILDRCFGRQPFYIEAKGFKIFYYHPQDTKKSSVWDMLAAMDDLHVIHLKRRNILHALISSRVAYKTGIYGVRSGREDADYRKKVSAITYSAENLEHDFQETRGWEQAGADRFARHPMMEIFYEDMASDLSGEIRKVTDFLGLDYSEPKTDFRKQRTSSLRSQVANYDELKANFAGTEWAQFFDE